MISAEFFYTPGLAVGAAFLGATANIMMRTLMRDVRSRDILSLNFAIMGAVLLVFSPWFYSFSYSLTALGLVALIALVDTAGNYFFLKSFEKSDASTVTPFLSLAPVFTFIVSALWLQERVSWGTLTLSLLIVAAVVIFLLDFKRVKEFHAETLLPALLSSALFGFSAVPSKFLLSELQAINPPTLYMFRAGLIAVFGFFLFRPKAMGLTPHRYGFIALRGLVVIGQWMLLYALLMMNPAGVAMTLGNLTPIFVFMLAMVFLKEKPTLKKLTAAALILVLSLLL